MLPVSIYLTPDGVEMIEGPGVTISDLRNQYPGCELIEVNHPAMSHNTDSFTLVPGVLYQITLPLTEGKLASSTLKEFHLLSQIAQSFRNCESVGIARV